MFNFDTWGLLLYKSHILCTDICVMQVVVAAESGGALGGLVRQLSIDQFENEGRRVSYGTTPNSALQARRLLDRQMSMASVQKKVQ